MHAAANDIVTSKPLERVHGVCIGPIVERFRIRASKDGHAARAVVVGRQRIEIECPWNVAPRHLVEAAAIVCVRFRPEIGRCRVGAALCRVFACRVRIRQRVKVHRCVISASVHGELAGGWAPLNLREWRVIDGGRVGTALRLVLAQRCAAVVGCHADEAERLQLP